MAQNAISGKLKLKFFLEEHISRILGTIGWYLCILFYMGYTKAVKLLMGCCTNETCILYGGFINKGEVSSTM